MDLDVIQRARDVITNATMAEIMREEPDGPEAFRNAVRQQVLALCICLKILLVVVDCMMALANALSQT